MAPLTVTSLTNGEALFNCTATAGYIRWKFNDVFTQMLNQNFTRRENHLINDTENLRFSSLHVYVNDFPIANGSNVTCLAATLHSMMVAMATARLCE